MDRRNFCRTTFSTAIALGIPGCLAGCNQTVPVLPPSEGITARTAVISGGNLYAMTRDAVDALGGMHTIMDHDVNNISQLTMGFNMGLGEIREGSIEILGDKLENLRVQWKAAKLMG